MAPFFTLDGYLSKIVMSSLGHIPFGPNANQLFFLDFAVTIFGSTVQDRLRPSKSVDSYPSFNLCKLDIATHKTLFTTQVQSGDLLTVDMCASISACSTTVKIPFPFLCSSKPSKN